MAWKQFKFRSHKRRKKSLDSISKRMLFTWLMLASAKAGDDLKRRREIRRRLEEIREARESARDLDSTFNFNLDDDL